MTLYVEAVDDGSNIKLTSQSIVLIKIIDVNDNPPVITINSKATVNDKIRERMDAYQTKKISDEKPANKSNLNEPLTFYITENSEPNEFVAHVTVTDSDSGKNGKFTCSLHTEGQYKRISNLSTNKMPTSENFELKRMYETEFKIITAKSLDREENSLYTLVVLCRDGGIPVINSSIFLNVKIIDVNDNKPQFVKRHFEAFLKRKVEVGNGIIQTHANDIDENFNSKILYSLRMLPAKSLFPSNENKNRIDSIKDQDHKHPQTFSGIYESTLKPNVTSYIDYRVRNKQIKRYQLAFSINPANGVISVTRPISISLSFQSPIQLNFIVNASDKGSPSLWNTATLSIYFINNETNFFYLSSLKYKFKIEENLPLGSQLGAVEVLRKYSFATKFLIEYFLTKQNCSSSHQISEKKNSVSRFKIGLMSGLIETTQSLDREEIDFYQMFVVAKVQIPKSRLKLNEKTNSKKSSNEFNNSYLGLNFEETLCSSLLISVIDFNDNSPYFTFPTATNNQLHLSTFDQPGAVIGRIMAKDDDLGENSLLSFSIVSGNEDGIVQLDPASGILVLMKTLPYQVSDFNKRTIDHMTEYKDYDQTKINENNLDSMHTFYREMVVEVEDNGFPTLSNRSLLVFIASPDHSLSNLRYDLEDKKYDNQTISLYHFLANEELVQILAAILACILILISLLIACICLLKKHYAKSQHVILKKEEEIDLAYIKTNKVHNDDLREGASKSLLLPQQAASFQKTATLDPSFYQVNVYKHHFSNEIDNEVKAHQKNCNSKKIGNFFKKLNKMPIEKTNNHKNCTSSEPIATFQNFLSKINKTFWKDEKNVRINHHYNDAKTNNCQAGHKSENYQESHVLNSKYHNDTFNNTRPFYSSSDDLDSNNNDYKLRGLYKKEMSFNAIGIKKINFTATQTNNVAARSNRSSLEKKFAAKGAETAEWVVNHAESIEPIGKIIFA